MGKPNGENVQRFREKLAWFSRTRYDHLNELDSLGWYKQIQVRRSLYKRLTVDLPHLVSQELPFSWIRSDAEYFLSVIKRTPVVDFEDDLEFEFEIPELRTPVHATTIEELYLAELSANESATAEVRRFFDKAKDYRYEAWRNAVNMDFYGHAENVASVIDSELTLAGNTAECDMLDNGFENEYFFDEDFSIRRRGQSPLHRYLGLKNAAILSVDLRVPESVLVEQFKALIDQLQTNEQKIRADKLNPAAWMRCGLLPYIDLELWRLTSALPNYGDTIERIPDSLIKELILKEDQSENSKHYSMDHTISKVTRVYFNQFCVESSSMYALLETEAASQFHQTGTQSRLLRYERMKRIRERKEREKKQNSENS